MEIYQPESKKKFCGVVERTPYSLFRAAYYFLNVRDEVVHESPRPGCRPFSSVYGTLRNWTGFVVRNSEHKMTVFISIVRNRFSRRSLAQVGKSV